MELLSGIWSMREGVSQCWLLSARCVIDWEAWAAIGTVGAVFAALFGPAIQRRVVRKKANALFGIAYQNDLIAAKVRLETLERTYPLDPNADDAWAVHEAATNGNTRATFLAVCNSLDPICQRDVDLTKWPAMDFELAAAVAVAIQRTREFREGAMLLANQHEHRDWHDFMGVVHKAFQAALEAVQTAASSVKQARRGF